MEFNDLMKFALHMGALEVKVREHAERALKKAAIVIEEDAKAQLGHYQPEKGPYGEWKPLAESTLKQHEAVGVGDTPLLVHGGLYASIQHECSGHEAVIGSKSEIAKYQEFGTDKIPPRPFIGPAAYSSRHKVEKIMAEGLVKGILGGNALLP